MKVHVKDFDTHIREILVEKSQGFRTMDEVDFHDPLQEFKYDQHDCTGSKRHYRKAVA